MKILLFLTMFSATLSSAVFGASCTDDKSAELLVVENLRLIVSPKIAGKTQPSSSSSFCLDLNGDGINDAVLLGTVRSDVTEVRVKESKIVFYKPLHTGDSIAEYNPRLRPSWVLNYRREPVLFVLLSHLRPTSSAVSFRRFAVVDFANSSADHIVPVTGPVRYASVGDQVRSIAPPKLKGTGLSFVNAGGAGSLVYWDGVHFRWYPIQAQ